LSISTSGTSENRIGKVAEIPIVAYNFGKKESPSINIKYGGYMSGYRTVPAIAAGGYYKYTDTVVVVNQPSIEINWYIDPDNIVAESNEENNAMTYTIFPVGIAGSNTT
ncbi:MAG TPA: CARDB domain-containing protein, partial [Candidatus Norongarragalinales archaeon]|nr:CARDB domain-containing protein [Candidatus Norongarragalinales archaeon]